MSTKKAKRKRPAAPVAVAEAAGPAAPVAAAEAAGPAATSQPAIVLAGNCTIKNAAELKDLLCRRLDDEAAVTLDAHGVERIDTSALQLLYAFARDRAAQGRKIEWVGEVAVVRDAAKALGLDALLYPPGGAS